MGKSGKNLLTFCPYNNYDTCPSLYRDGDNPSQERPFYITDLHDPRGTVWLSQDEVLALADGGSETVRVIQEGDDVLIIDSEASQLRMTTEQFDCLVESIRDGSALEAMLAVV